MKAAALVIALLAAGVQLSASKKLPDLPYNTEGTDKTEVVVYPSSWQYEVAVYPSSWQCKIDALEEEGLALDSCEATAMDEDEFHVKHGGACRVVVQDPVSRMSFMRTATCQRGVWSTSGTRSAMDPPQHRPKRWVAAVIASAIGVAVIAGQIIYAVGCSDGTWCEDESHAQTVINKQPTYTTCPPNGTQSVYYTPAGQEAVVITWDDPVAEDSDGDVESNVQTSGTTKGELFAGLPRVGGLTHTILYKATDNAGMSEFCSFTFAVEVRTCGPLPWPLNGYRDCANVNNILGSTCQVRCNEGYSPVGGISETTCVGEDNPQWSAEPYCQKITCSTPPQVPDGNVTCNDGHKFGDHCIFSCRDGYTLQGQVLTTCEATGDWSFWVPTTCIDGIAPELSCNTPQIFYAGWASSSTSVEWVIPSATDNKDPIPAVTKTAGPEPGVEIEAGSSAYVTYVATDETGNQSPPCNVELRVEATSCGHPLDTLGDGRLRFACTTDPQYIYGDTCTLSCGLNLPLEGTDLIACNRTTNGVGPPIGYWDWDNGTMPHCRDIACPDMLPPRNGALVFGTVIGRPLTTMLCMKDFTLEVPSIPGFTGMFICEDSGVWNPSYEDNKAPDCSVVRTGRTYSLPGEFFYYDGVCGVNDTILANYGEIIANLGTINAALCPTGTVCEAKNPKVTCGEYRKKRSVRRRSTRGGENTADSPHMLEKRQTATTLEFSFELVISFDTSQMNNQEIWDYADYVQLTLLKPAIQEAVNNGSFDRPDWRPLDDFQTAECGETACDPGSVLVQLTKCSECPAGHFELDGACVKCPVGEYCETGGSPSCTTCPGGYSTRGEASESHDNCTQLCTPGTYSPDTFVPCAKCPAGLYQSGTGQTHCLPCPTGTSTKSMGSTSDADCQAFDAIVTDTGDDALTFNIPMLTNLALEFFIKAVSGTPDIVISVNGELDVAIAETITVSTSSTADDIGAPSDDAWIQVSIYWDTTTGEFRAFYRGNLVASHSSVFPTVTPLVQDGQMYISASGDAVLLSGLRLRDSLLEEAGNIPATTCQSLDATDVINMEDLKFVDEITILVPSVCDVVDECLSSPCSDHSSKCTNVVHGFTCTCMGGWTGDTCDTPPDYCPGNNCQNGATCVSELTDYMCQCHPGFTGVNCETPPVDGGWSVWARWTECSTTCDTGSRDRTRSCDSPVPDDYGQDCTGVDFEMEECNTSPCPVCPALERGYGSLPNCYVDPVTGTYTCIAICVEEDHMLLSSLGNNKYTCGIETGYTWQPNQKLPGCAEVDRPERYTVIVNVPLDQTVPQSDEEVVVSGIEAHLAATPCYESSHHCSTDIQIVDDTGTRRKRNTGSTVKVTFSIDLTDTSDLQLDEFIQNGTISPGLQEIIDDINNLEATAVAINDSASTYFDVTANGVTYTVDTNTVTFHGATICSERQVVTHGFCAECPAGSYQAGDYCALCDKGTYQDQTGQAECVPCPTDYTTATVGSDSSADCSILETTTSSPKASTQSSSQSTSSATEGRLVDDESDGGMLIIVITVVSVLVVTIIGVIAAIVCVMKHKTGRAKFGDSNPILHDSTPDVHCLPNPIYTMPPASTFVAKPAVPETARPSSALTIRDLNLDV